MRLSLLAALISMVLAVPAFAADPLPPAAPPAANVLDSQSILPATVLPSLPGKDGTTLCYRMRTYRVRKDLDRDSVIHVRPDEVTFDPDSIVGYSTCQRAEKFDLHTTH
jgi:hypothetical protein